VIDFVFAVWAEPPAADLPLVVVSGAQGTCALVARRVSRVGWRWMVQRVLCISVKPGVFELSRLAGAKDRLCGDGLLARHCLREIMEQGKASQTLARIAVCFSEPWPALTRADDAKIRRSRNEWRRKSQELASVQTSTYDNSGLLREREDSMKRLIFIAYA